MNKRIVLEEKYEQKDGGGEYNWKANYDWYFNQEAYHPFTYMPTKRIDGS